MYEKPGLSQSEFNAHWRERYAPAFLKAVEGKGLVRKHVRSELLELDAKVSKGSLFEFGGGAYAGVKIPLSGYRCGRMRQEP